MPGGRLSGGQVTPGQHAASLVAVDGPRGRYPPGGRQAALAVLADRFRAGTAALVAAVTNPAWEPGRDKHEQYREHILAALQASPWARVIKASDFTDNAVSIIDTTGPKLPELARKYGPLVPTLRVLILRPDTPLEDDVKGTVAAQLDAAQARLARHQARPPRRSSASAWSCARRETEDSRRRNGPMAYMTLALGSCSHTHQFAAARRQRP